MVQHSVGLRAEPGTVLVANGHCGEVCREKGRLDFRDVVQAPASWTPDQPFYVYIAEGPVLSSSASLSHSTRDEL